MGKPVGRQYMGFKMFMEEVFFSYFVLFVESRYFLLAAFYICYAFPPK